MTLCIHQKRCVHRRTGPFLGGTTIFARISHLCPKSQICLGDAFLPHMEWGGGGGGVRRAALFEWLSMGHHRGGRVWEGVSPSHGGEFFEILGTKKQVLGTCVMNFELTIKSSSKCIWLQYTRGKGGTVLCYYNVLVTNGEGVGRDTPSHGGDVLEFWVLNTVFCALLGLN